MKNDAFKRAVDSIEPQPGAKQRMYQNILKKAAQPAAGMDTADPALPVRSGSTDAARLQDIAGQGAAAAPERRDSRAESVPLSGGRAEGPSASAENRSAEKRRSTGGRRLLPALRRYALPLAACFCLLIIGLLLPHRTTPDPDLQVGSPFVSVSGPSDFKPIGISLDAPAGAENVSYAIIDGSIASVEFSAGGHVYLLRASRQSGDFSGVNGEEAAVEALDARTAATLAQLRTADGPACRVHWTDGSTNCYLVNTDGASVEAVRALAQELIRQDTP